MTISKLIDPSPQMFSKDGADGGGDWVLVSQFLGRLDTQMIRYTGTRGDGYLGDIALDDINIAGCDVSAMFIGDLINSL